MSSPSSYLALSQRLTSTSSLLLERSRVISLNLPPSASSQNQIVRNLTLIKADLDKLQDQAQLESSGLSVGGSGSGSGGSARGKGKKAEGQAEKQLRELGEQYDRLVEMLAEDAIGKEKAKSLRREKPCVQPGSRLWRHTDAGSAPQPEPVHEAPQAPAHGIGEDSDDETLPRLNVEPPTPMDRTGITPFKDYPDDYEPEEERTSREMLDQQQVMMDGLFPFNCLMEHALSLRRPGRAVELVISFDWSAKPSGHRNRVRARHPPRAARGHRPCDGPHSSPTGQCAQTAGPCSVGCQTAR